MNSIRAVAPLTRRSGMAASLALALAVLSATAIPASAQQTREATLLGTAISAASEEPLADAEVRILGTDHRAVTGQDGAFRIDGITPGLYQMEVRYLGASSGTATIRLEPASRLGLTITVFERLVEVDELEVEIERRPERGKLAGFYERRSQGRGSFLTLEQIERAPGHHLDTVFRQVPGVSVLSSGRGVDGSRHRVVNTRTNCAFSVYLDGTRLFDGPGALGLRSFVKEDIAAIEIYRGPAQVPPLYRDSSSPCGVILLWTRIGTEAV